MSDSAEQAGGTIIPMSIGTAFEHINACMRNRRIIEGVVASETEEGVCYTIRRIGKHRTPVDIPVIFPGTTMESPVTEVMLANYAIAVGLGRHGDRPYHNSRSLTRQTALYVGLDGLYHITGQPDRVAPSAVIKVVQGVACRPDRLVA